MSKLISELIELFEAGVFLNNDDFCLTMPWCIQYRGGDKCVNCPFHSEENLQALITELKETQQ